MEKNDFFTIGELSKLTGVHVKSLRYYGRLGILRPAFVDPGSGYRYYTFPQIRLVEAIQFCVELGIPLNRFNDYLADGGGSIRYSKLVERGAALANEKIRAIQERLNELVTIQEEIEHAEACLRSDAPVRYAMPQLDLLTLPYSGAQKDPQYRSEFNRLLAKADNMGLMVGYNAGLILLNGEQLLYVDVETTGKEHCAGTVRLPAAEYLCVKSGPSGIAGAAAQFPSLLSQPCSRIILETELFTGEYDFNSPVMELRCSVDEFQLNRAELNAF